MSERKTEATAYLIDYICDKCGVGKMVRVGQIKLKPLNYEGKPLFPHRCENCGHTDEFEGSYPFPRFEPISEKWEGH